MFGQKIRNLLGSAILMAGGLSSCTIYHNYTVPLDVNLNATPVQPTLASDAGDVKHFSFYVNVDWDSNGLGDIAAKHGMQEIYYADLNIFNIFGIWGQDIVHVYGR